MIFLNLNFYTTSDAPNVLTKTLTAVKAITGAICKENCSILSPVFIVAYDANLLTVNYAYCAEFSRYYFLTDITVMTGGRLQITGRVDVLGTYGATLKTLTALMTRTEDEPTEVVDNFLPLKRNKITKVYEFTGGDFNIDVATNTSYNFVLNIMGGGTVQRDVATSQHDNAEGDNENVRSE